MSVDVAEDGPSLGGSELIFATKDKKGVETLGMVLHDRRLLAGDILDGIICSVQDYTDEKVWSEQTSNWTRSSIATTKESCAMSSDDCNIPLTNFSVAR